MTNNQRSEELENRLIDFTVRIINVAEHLPTSYTGIHFGKQIVRSGSAPALLYAEARGAESTKDFRHKCSIALKELRETFVNLKIINRVNFVTDHKISEILDENNQLISLFVTIIKSTDDRLKNGRSKDQAK